MSKEFKEACSDRMKGTKRGPYNKDKQVK